MGHKINLLNNEYGCWKVIEELDSRLLNCGTKRPFWKMQCTKCNSTFEKNSRDLARLKKLKAPADCTSCHVTKKYARKTVHYQGMPCNGSALYPVTTDIPRAVTCKICRGYYD